MTTHTTLTIDIHVPGGIRSRNLSRRGALDRAATGNKSYVRHIFDKTLE